MFYVEPITHSKTNHNNSTAGHESVFTSEYSYMCLPIVVIVVVVLMFYVQGKYLRSVNLTTLFLGMLRPPKRLTSTSCTYCCQ